MKKWFVGLLAVSCLSACVPLVFVGGAAMGLMIGSDPRKSESIKSDFDLDAQLEAKIIDAYKQRAHVNVNVFNGVVLMTGEVADNAMKSEIEKMAWEMKQRPRKVYNEVVIGDISSAADRMNDSQISARVKTAVLAEAGDSSAFHVMVVTERQVVYLLGVSKSVVSDRAAHAASKVRGVKQVVKLIELDPESPVDKR